MSDSPKDMLEKLKKQRAELESELLAKWKHRTPFEVEAEILRENVAIQELKKELDRVNNRTAQVNLELKKLEDRVIQESEGKINIGELEDKMKSTKEFATSGITRKSGAKAKDKIDKPETDEQTRVIWKKDIQTPESDETSDAESDKAPEEKEKKKRKFF
jgi:chromosome condensin MukBEF MukE localization factor